MQSDEIVLGFSWVQIENIGLDFQTLALNIYFASKKSEKYLYKVIDDLGINLLLNECKL